MPIRKDKDIRADQSGITGAMDSDANWVKKERARLETTPLAPEPKEKKTAIVQLTTYPSWRQHFKVEAAKNKTNMSAVMLKAMIAEFGLPEGATYPSDEEE